MNIVEQPNRWSCMPAAFATATGISLDVLIERIGHDGSEIIFPDLPEPMCRRAFHGQELIRALFELGFHVFQFEFEPYGVVDERHGFYVVWNKLDEYIANLLSDSIGVIGATVKPTGKYHAVAWDGRQCYDPMGFIYPLERFKPLMYYKIHKG